MSKYINKKTGFILETKCVIHGNDWEEVVEKATSSDTFVEKTVVEKKIPVKKSTKKAK